MAIKRIFTFMVVAVIGGASAACGVGDLESLRTAPRQGTVFQGALADAYLGFAEWEAEQYDWPDSQHFAAKGLTAAAGRTVLPEPPQSWRLPPAHRGEIGDAHERLNAVLDAGGRSDEPALAAQAQFNYDCWLEQQEENHQSRHIADCRDELMRSLRQLEGIVLARADGTDAPRYIVYFLFDRSQLTPAGAARLKVLLADPAIRTAARLRIEGHADRAGSDAHNATLSSQRALAVRQALIGDGLAAERIEVRAFGERRPAVATGDGVAEPKNRRVEVFLAEKPVRMSRSQ